MPVEQVDREAVHALLGVGYDDILEGRKDTLSVVQAFAAHREKAIAEAEAENARLREALRGPLAWLERWAVHVGNCKDQPLCGCGLIMAQHELRAAVGERP